MRYRLKSHLLIFIIFNLMLLQGCIVGPNYTKPDLEVPDIWHHNLTAGLSDNKANLQNWWTLLNDPLLNALITQAGNDNLTLQEAIQRIQEAHARLGIASGQRVPDLDGTGGYTRQKFGQNAPTTNSYSIGVDTTWEIDFWGRISRAIESADAGIQASLEDYRDIQVLLYSEIAQNYVQLRTLQYRVKLAKDNVQIQKKTLQLTMDRNKAGLVPELDVRQAERNLAITESIIPTLKSQQLQAMNRLGVLIGKPPHTLHHKLSATQPIPGLPKEITIGIPSDLVRQRPDIRRSERQLAEQTAQIGIATADLYPRFSLSGSFALVSTNSGDLFQDDKTSFVFGPSFRWNLFDGDRVRNNIKVENAQTEQALIRYEQSVLLALEEVDNAIIAYTNEYLRESSLMRSVIAAQKSVELVDTLYKSGLTDFQNVLDTQRSLFTQQDQHAESQGNVVLNLIRIYKALGGGWAPEDAIITDYNIKDK